MPRATFARQVALLLVTALWPALAFAVKVTYEGLLVPDGRNKPIPIVVQLEGLEGFLAGRVKVSPPLLGDSPIQDGRYVAGTCSMAAVLSAAVTLRLSGTCNTSTFEGVFTIVTQPKAQTKGTFRLSAIALEEDRARSATDTVATTTGGITACLKANTRCLTACPRGDEDVEFLCANRCRSKLHACKGKAGKETAASE